MPGKILTFEEKEIFKKKRERDRAKKEQEIKNIGYTLQDHIKLEQVPELIEELKKGITHTLPVDRIKISNIVARTALNQPINLRALSEKLPYVSYNPNSFAAMPIKFATTDSKIVVMIFESGKILSTAAKSMWDLRITLNTVIKMIQEIFPNKYKIVSKLTVKNIVVSATTGREIDLELLYNSDQKMYMYDKNNFPGVRMKIKGIRPHALIFRSGCIVLPGCRNEESYRLCINYIYSKIFPYFKNSAYFDVK